MKKLLMILGLCVASLSHGGERASETITMRLADGKHALVKISDVMAMAGYLQNRMANKLITNVDGSVTLLDVRVMGLPVYVDRTLGATVISSAYGVCNYFGYRIAEEWATAEAYRMDAKRAVRLSKTGAFISQVDVDASSASVFVNVTCSLKRHVEN